MRNERLVRALLIGEGGRDGYETRQSSLLYVFVLYFGFDPAQKHNRCLLHTEQLTNKNVLAMKFMYTVS